MHLHLRHVDYLVVIQGMVSLGLYDLRPKSPTFRMSSLMDLSGDPLSYVVIPAGVIHGIYCHEKAIHMYGVDFCYDPGDEFGCYWGDPSLGIAWQCADPILSERDRNAGSLADLEVRLGAEVV
jgi:dTDP-4-dehydrorhamnose 3,5-epimerase